jgi:hypothetical protein
MENTRGKLAVAKGPSSKGGMSKVRLIVFEAEISDGDISQVTQAIQNALRPSQTAPRLLQVPSDRQTGASENVEYEEVSVEDDEEPVGEVPRQRPTRSGKPRVAKTPTVLDDIDATTDPSLKDFVAQFDLTTTVDKYLVVALWFRDARSTPSISVDHVYTCFRLLGWSTTSNDFAKPMRNLRDEQSFKGGSKDGFTLTLPGAGKIEAKKRPQ